MALNGAQHAQIQKALLSAFEEAGLRQLLLHELDADLDDVAGGQNTTEVVFNLIKWADQTGCVRQLIDGALRQNPNNPALQALAKAASSWQLDAPAGVVTDAPASLPTRAQGGNPVLTPSGIDKRDVETGGVEKSAVEAQAITPPLATGRKVGGGVWIAGGLVLAVLALALVFWLRPPQTTVPASTATPELPATLPAATAAAAAATATIAVTPAGPAATIAAGSAGLPAETPAAAPSSPPPLAVAIEPFTGCAEPNPFTALYTQLQNQLRQSDAEAAVQLTLLTAAGAAASAEPPYAIVLAGDCPAEGEVVYTADILLVGDGKSERVAEPVRLELPWPDTAPPTKTLAALLIYHAEEDSLLPVALLNQEAAWDKAPADRRLTLYWFLGNTLLASPNGWEERARTQYQHALDLAPAGPSGISLVAQLHNNRGWAYYEQARNINPAQDPTGDIQRMFHVSATQEFSQAVAMDGMYGMAWVNLGTAYLRLKNYEQASASCEQALLKSDQSAPALVCQSNIHYTKFEFAEALALAQMALEEDPEHAIAYYLAGMSNCVEFKANSARTSLLLFLEWYPSLSRWDRFAPLYAEAQKVLEQIADNTRC